MYFMNNICCQSLPWLHPDLDTIQDKHIKYYDNSLGFTD